MRSTGPSFPPNRLKFHRHGLVLASAIAMGCLIASAAGCSDDDQATNDGAAGSNDAAAINDAAMGSDGATTELTATRQGALVHQDGPETSGDVVIGHDAENNNYLVLLDTFTSDFSSGTVTVYLAKTDANLAEQRTADATSVSVKIGDLEETGARAFSIPASVDIASYDYVIIWCETVAINFAAAQLSDL